MCASRCPEEMLGSAGINLTETRFSPSTPTVWRQKAERSGRPREPASIVIVLLHILWKLECRPMHEHSPYEAGDKDDASDEVAPNTVTLITGRLW